MPSEDFHIAQFNYAKLLAPLDDPRLAEFVGALERINAIADDSPASSGACRARAAMPHRSGRWAMT